MKLKNWKKMKCISRCKMALSIDEISIIKLYSNYYNDKSQLLENIKNNINYVNDVDIKLLMESVVRKVTAMTDATFNNIDFSVAIDQSLSDELQE